MSESKNNQVNSTVVLIAGLLAVVAFFMGTLWQKSQMLEAQVNNNAGNVKANVPTPDAPKEPTVGKIPDITDDDHILGDKDASVVLVEYSDFECPFCKRFHPTTKKILDKYGDKVALVYRHFPLSFHQSALPLANASECLAELGGNDGFWAFADAVYSADKLPDTDDAIKTFVANLGYDQTAFSTCYDANKYEQKIKDEMAGGSKAGIKGTPGTVVLAKDGNTDFISGALPYDQVEQIVSKYVK